MVGDSCLLCEQALLCPGSLTGTGCSSPVLSHITSLPRKQTAMETQHTGTSSSAVGERGSGSSEARPSSWVRPGPLSSRVPLGGTAGYRKCFVW